MTTSPAATSLEIYRLLGEVDPFVVERILEVGATLDEVAEAVRAAQDDETSGDAPPVPSSPRVVEVRHILDDVLAMEWDEDDGYASGGAPP
jgi:hypothetical protein